MSLSPFSASNLKIESFRDLLIWPHGECSPDDVRIDISQFTSKFLEPLAMKLCYKLRDGLCRIVHESDLR
jgi:hypothetical protein